MAEHICSGVTGFYPGGLQTTASGFPMRLLGAARSYRYLVLTCLMASSALQAHHASAPHFFRDQVIVIEGAVITELKLVNPHSYIYFHALGDDNQMANWRCGLRPAVALRRQGWSVETFPPGLEVTIEGHPAKREDNVCLITAIVLADGTKIGPLDNLNGGVATRSLAPAIGIDSMDRSVPLANGQPNISGDWVSVTGMGELYRTDRLDPSEANIEAAESYDVRFDDPTLKCHPINIILGWLHDANTNQISQLDDRVLLTYGWMDLVRSIYLDAEHPQSLEPTVAGHSVGTWEGDVLVVDTIGFLPGVLSHRVGILHSDQMHISERIYYDEATGELVRDYVIEDPLYLNTPFVSQDRLSISAEPYAPYNCTELSGANNIRLED